MDSRPLNGRSAKTIMTPTTRTPWTSGFEVRFRSLFVEGRGLAFPCDPTGSVDLDALSDQARTNYLFARAMVGREYAAPVVLAH
jgi:hypothetical protein